MTEHLSILSPDDTTPKDLMRMAEDLFSPLTPIGELERICMTLAHLPTEDAQGLLARFKDSPRAREVDWLECAIDEGAYHLLSPTDEHEEREFLILSVIQELDDEVLELESELARTRLSRDKAEIRLAALTAMADANRVHPAEIEGLRCAIQRDEERIAALGEEIGLKEAMIEHLKASITTTKYRNADPVLLRHIHWDG